VPETLHNAPIAIVDEDQSPLSAAHCLGLLPAAVHAAADDRFQPCGPGHGRGTTPSLTFRPTSSATCWPGAAALQLNVDATRMSQAFTGSGYIQQIVLAEVNEFVQRHRGASALPVDLALRARFNPD
jgi:ABC-2 type transport system permease protein